RTTFRTLHARFSFRPEAHSRDGKNECGRVAAEAMAGNEDRADAGPEWAVVHDVQVAARIRMVAVRGRRHLARIEGHERARDLEDTGRAQRMTERALDRGDRYVAGAGAEQPMQRARLGHVGRP